MISIQHIRASGDNVLALLENSDVVQVALAGTYGILLGDSVRADDSRTRSRYWSLSFTVFVRF